MNKLNILSIIALGASVVSTTIGGVALGKAYTVESVPGPAGPQGEKGDKGDTGAQGIQGEKGDQGERGEKGDKGDKGDTGAKGDKGDRGEAGVAGVNGSDGKDGQDGKDAESPYPTAWYKIAPSNWSYSKNYTFRYLSDKMVEYKCDYSFSPRGAGDSGSAGYYYYYISAYSPENTWNSINIKVTGTLSFSWLYSTDLGDLSTYYANKVNKIDNIWNFDGRQNVTYAEFLKVKELYTEDYLTSQLKNFLSARFKMAINNFLYDVSNLQWTIKISDGK